MITLKTAVKDCKGFFEKVKFYIRELGPGNTITVGIHADAGSQDKHRFRSKILKSGKNKGKRKQVKVTSGISKIPKLIDVAYYNEFGTKNAPPRSFVRGYVDENREKIRRITKFALKRKLKAGKSKYDAYNEIGAQLANGMRSRLRKGIQPANASFTIQNKGHGRTLQETGQLLKSIGYRVRGQGTVEGDNVVAPSADSESA